MIKRMIKGNNQESDQSHHHGNSWEDTLEAFRSRVKKYSYEVYQESDSWKSSGKSTEHVWNDSFVTQNPVLIISCLIYGNGFYHSHPKARSKRSSGLTQEARFNFLFFIYTLHGLLHLSGFSALLCYLGIPNLIYLYISSSI